MFYGVLLLDDGLRIAFNQFFISLSRRGPETRAAAPLRRIELPSLDRQSSCLTRCIQGQINRADGARTRTFALELR